MILHGVMNIFVVPINAESDLKCKECTESECKKTEEKPEEKPEEKIKHCDIYEEMIRISINNPYNLNTFYY